MAAFHHHEEISEELFRGRWQAEVPGASHTWRIHSTASWLHNLQPQLDEGEEGIEESLQCDQYLSLSSHSKSSCP